MLGESFDKLARYPGGHRVVFLQVVVLVDPDHHLRNQRAVRVNGCHRDVLLQRLIKVSRLLVALGHLVLGIRRKGMIRESPDDDPVRLDRLLPILLLLRKLAKQVAYPCRVFFIRKILGQLE